MPAKAILKLLIFGGATLHKMEEYVPILVGKGPRTGYPKTMLSKKLEYVIQCHPEAPYLWWCNL